MYFSGDITSKFSNGRSVPRQRLVSFAGRLDLSCRRNRAQREKGRGWSDDHVRDPSSPSFSPHRRACLSMGESRVLIHREYIGSSTQCVGTLQIAVLKDQ